MSRNPTPLYAAITIASIAAVASTLVFCPSSAARLHQSSTSISPASTTQENPNAAPENGPQHPLEAKTEMVKLDVTVLDSAGNFVGGLTQEKFHVLDNGVERPVIFFTPVEAPARVVVLLETSPAVYLVQDEHIAAAFSLLNGLARDDEVALVTYAEIPRQLVPFTTDKGMLMNALAGNQYMMGMADLNLYQSTAAVVDGIAPMPGKKAIVLLSTGLDTSSPEHFDALVQKLQSQDVVIYAVGLGGSLNQPAPKVKGAKKQKMQSQNSGQPSTLDRARTALQKLAQITGGGAYFPGNGQTFATAYQEIAAALRHEYVLGIAPEHDGQLHKLSVSVAQPADPSTKHHKSHDHPEYRVAAREGYVAPKP